MRESFQQFELLKCPLLSLAYPPTSNPRLFCLSYLIILTRLRFLWAVFTSLICRDLQDEYRCFYFLKELNYWTSVVVWWLVDMVHWSGKISQAAEQLSRCTTATEAHLP